MAATAPAADQATDLLQNLSLNSKSEVIDAPVAKEKASGGLDGKLNGVAATPNPPVAPTEQWANPALQDYYSGYPAAYYYGGWGDYPMYLSHDGAETPTAGAYGDLYCCTQYGVAAPGHDGQMYGSQLYQYPSTYHQPQTPASKTSYKARIDKLPPKQEDVTAAAAADPLPAVVDASKATANNIDDVKDLKKTLPLKPSGCLSSYQNQSTRPAYLWYGDQTYSAKQQRLSSGNPTLANSNPKNKGQLKNQSIQSLPHQTGLHGHNSQMGSMYSGNGMYNRNVYGPGLWYGSHMYGPALYGGWNALSDGKYKPQGKTYGYHGFGNENPDGLNELKRGPRSGFSKNQQGLGAAVATPAKGQDVPASNGSNEVLQDQYNWSDFLETYSDAKFFIIKSYSEDDVHKSIKYNVWASTPNGNKKLDTAYLEAKEKLSNSPVFLFFSVNTSGQFVGLAEMVGQVDFTKTVDYWQQDKWTGCFPVKWHIVKDIPNNLLKHIILEYNENKPVTNSRDTQEVKLDQGLQMLKIFKDHVCKTSILDDFGFYDNREKIMQEKKSLRQHPLKKIENKKLPIISTAENEANNGKQGLQKIEVVGEENSVIENGLAADSVNGVAPKDANLTAEGLAVDFFC